MDKWSKSLLFICTLALIAALLIYVFHTRHETVHHVVTIETDSIGNITPQAKVNIDSVMYVLEAHNHLIEDKYEYAINQQTNTQDMLAIGGLLLGIIVSIVGFFGYSTMQAIKDKAKEFGEEAAKKAYDDKTKDLQNKDFKKYLDDIVLPEAKRTVQESLSQFKDEKIESIDNIEEQIERLAGDVENIKRKMKMQPGTHEEEPRTEINPFENQKQ